MRVSNLHLCVLALTLRASSVLGFTPAFHQASPSIGIHSPSHRSTRLLAVSPVNPLDISGSLISQLAEIAIKLRLKDQTAVQCDVSSTSTDLLLGGKIGPVTVRGRGWGSSRGLTCRVIEATVQSCELDVGRIASSRKLVLNTPAEGKAMIALDKTDWGNFITHPLMRPPQVMDGESPKFLKDNAEIDAGKGTVVFFSEYRGQTWQCTLQRAESSQGSARVTVTPVEQEADEATAEQAQELSSSLTTFFNELVYELDGTFLSYVDMMVTDRGAAPSVMLALNILVRKFPSPGLDF